MSIKIEQRLPTVDEYLFLVDSVGWSEYASAESAATALSNSLFSVVAMDGNKIVGTARIIGDRALFFYIQDVIVIPAVQGRGVGAKIMEALMEWLRVNAPAKATVGLFAAEGKGPFYEKYGFAARSSGRPGMDLLVNVGQ